MSNNHHFMSIVIKERIDTAMQEAEARRLAQEAMTNRPPRQSLLSRGRTLLSTISQTFVGPGPKPNEETGGASPKPTSVVFLLREAGGPED